VTITTKAGHTLVDGVSSFRLAFESATSIPNLQSSSTYNGLPVFSGESSREYTVKILNNVYVPPVSPAEEEDWLKFSVSVDGGKTWMTNEAGVSEFTYTGEAFLLPDGRGSLTFPDGDVGKDTLQAGDRFTVLPNKSLFWYETSSSKINITPQIMPNGEDNERRLTGGTLAGYFQFRDSSVGGYLEKLDAFAKSLAWEVNRIHSQGAGLERFEQVVGTYGVTNSGLSLQTGAGLAFGDKLEDGNLMIGVYDKNTGAMVQFSALDFSADDGVQNFVAKNHSLESVVEAINRAFPGKLTASVLDNHLQIEAGDDYDFAFGSDSTGLLAALGINTFFDGSDARTLSLNNDVRSNASRINTGHVNGAGEMNEGDNTTAAAIAALQAKAVSTRTVTDGISRQTLGEYYSTLVAKAGSDTKTAKFNFEYQQALANDLKARQESVSGVNLDEEMTNLIKFQHAYTAAAKLITTAESMLQVLLGLKN
jgi:flagellar hook-associated protein 1 FlgK